jgi:hypothetical protein
MLWTWDSANIESASFIATRNSLITTIDMNGPLTTNKSELHMTTLQTQFYDLSRAHASVLCTVSEAM